MRNLTKEEKEWLRKEIRKKGNKAITIRTSPQMIDKWNEVFEREYKKIFKNENNSVKK